MKITYRAHAIMRMFQRRIYAEDVYAVISSGEIIENYPEDTPYPSRLILGWIGKRPLHVVTAYHAKEDITIVITVYEPDPALWSDDFRRRLV